MSQSTPAHIDEIKTEPWFKRIHHVGIAVPNLDEAIPKYEALFGQAVQRIEEVHDQKVRTAFSASEKATLNSWKRWTKSRP